MSSKLDKQATGAVTIDDVARALSARTPRLVSLRTAPQRAAVAVVLRDHGGGVELLYIQRVEQPGDPWSGHMAFPGGHVDRDDRGALDAAIREAEEEVDLRLDRDARELGRLDDLQAMARGRHIPLAITPIVFELLRPVTLVASPAEVVETLWVPLDGLIDGRFESTLAYERNETVTTLPCWQVEKHCIWGLTYLMTRDLLQLIGVDGLSGDPRQRPRARGESRR